MKAYFDGSGDNRTPFLTLTGVAATDRVWKPFDSEWKRILTARVPTAPYLHMRDLFSLSGEFRTEKGWDRAKASQLMWDCLMYAQHLDKHEFRTFTCTIDMEAYRGVRDRGLRLPSPYAICSRFSPELIVRWYVQNFEENFPQELCFFFDQGERYKGAFQQRWIKGKKSGKGLSTHWHLIKSVTPVDMRYHPAVQLADLISWSHNRRLSVKDDEVVKPWQRLSDIVENVLPFTRKEITRQDLELYAMVDVIAPERLNAQFE